MLPDARTSEKVEARLQSRTGLYSELCDLTSQPAISIGVLHNNQKIFSHHIGRKDVQTDSVPDEDTIYCIASLSKQLVAATLSTLIADSKLTLDCRLSSILPGFSNKSDHVIGDRTTIRDILSHRSGLSGLDLVVQGINGELTLSKEEILGFANALPAMHELRAKWSYNNMGYSIAGQVIEKITGEPWAAAVESCVCKPLRMSRTTCDRSIHWSDSNVAKPYNVLTTGELIEVPPSRLDGDHINGAAGGVRSTVRDLLRWASALMSSAESPYMTEHEYGRESPAKGYMSMSVPKISTFTNILEAHAIIDPKAPSESNYGLGIVRQSTPAALGTISPNRNFTSPIMGASSPSMRVFSHHGDFDGATCSFYMFPASHSAVVVLSNAKGLSDATDWISQDIIQTMFALGPSIDILREARLCRSSYEQWYGKTIQGPLSNGRVMSGNVRDLHDYIGEYLLDGYSKWKLVVKAKSDEMRKMLLLLNDKTSQSHVLSHYHFDTWEFAPKSYDDYIKYGYGPYVHPEEFLLVFERGGDGRILSLLWRVDGSDLHFTKG